MPFDSPDLNLGALLEDIRLGKVQLPDFQREWKGRVTQLMQRPPGAHAKQFGRPPVRQPRRPLVGPGRGRRRRGLAGGHPGRLVRGAAPADRG
jgi:hypothetical protein